jgi:ATP-dependent Clp protease ATP-binding subunit ClpA
MFERFTDDARTVVKRAQEDARAFNHRHIGPEHLLLALTEGDGVAAEALRAQGIGPATIRDQVARLGSGGPDPLDSEALRTIGIDLDAVREATEQTFGEGALDSPPGRRPKGHIAFTPAAKKALELSLRHALRLKHKFISDGHILLGVIHVDDVPVSTMLVASGAGLDALRADVTRRIKPAA